MTTNYSRRSIAAKVLVLHGSLELLGIPLFIFAPVSLMSVFFPAAAIGELLMCCLLFGFIRLGAAYAIQSKQKFASFLGKGVSFLTFIATPLLVFVFIQPPLPGVILSFLLDYPAAITVLLLLQE